MGGRFRRGSRWSAESGGGRAGSGRSGRAGSRGGRAGSRWSAAIICCLLAVTAAALVASGAYTSERNDAERGTTKLARWEMSVRDADGAEVEGWPSVVEAPADLRGLEPGWTVTLSATCELDPQAALYVSTYYAPYRLYVDGELEDSYGAEGTYPTFLSDPPPFSSVALVGGEGGPAHVTVVYTVPERYWGLRLAPVEAGSFDAMRVMLFSRMGFAFSFGEATIALGLVLALFGAIVRRLDESGAIFLWLGMFCVCIGMWSVGECDLSSVIIKRPVTLHLMTYVGLYALLVPLTHLTRIAIGRPDDRLSDVLCRASELFALAAVVLQLAGVWQFPESLFAYYAVSISLFGLMTARLLAHLVRNRGARTPFRVYYLAVVLVFDVFLALELANYYAWHAVAEMVFCEVGSVVFTVSLVAISGVYLRGTIEERLAAQEMRHRATLVSRQAEAERKQVRAIVDTSDEIRRQRHDFKHQLAVIRGYNEEGDRAGLEAYLDEIGAAVPEGDRLRRYCANFSINAVVQYYADVARARGVGCVDARLDLPAALDATQESELAGVVGNLMENAVRAAAEVRAAGAASAGGPGASAAAGAVGPGDLRASGAADAGAADAGGPCASGAFVRLRGRTANGIVTIVQENSCTDVRRDASGAFVSPREGGGIGLQSIERVAEKYRGGARFEVVDGVFRSAVYLHLASPGDDGRAS